MSEVGPLTLGEKPLSILPLELLSLVNVLCCVPLCLLCRFTKYTLVDTTIGPTLTLGIFANSLVSLWHFSPGHWCKSLLSGHRTAVVLHLDTLWDLWRQLRPWPGPTQCVCAHKAYSFKTRLVLTVEELIVLSDVSQVLNLESHQQKCNFIVCTVTWKDFSSSS